MNNLFFLDLFILIFSMQFVHSNNTNLITIFMEMFITSLNNFLGFLKNMPSSYFSSTNIFLFILCLCILSYIPFSICLLGIPEFTLFFALISWCSVFLSFISSEKYSIFMSKSGDSFFITFFMLMMETLTEFLRPITLTIRLTVNIVVGHMIGSGIYFLIENNFNLTIFILYFVSISVEFLVFLIQSFVFSRLISVYLME